MQRPKNKHNKKRNTAFLYEVLVKELTKNVVEKNESKKQLIVSMLKEHFSKGTILHSELNLYKGIQWCKLFGYEIHEARTEATENFF